MYCEHYQLISTARIDRCPECKYEYYYGDAHAIDPELSISRLVNKGQDRVSNGAASWQEEREVEEAAVREQQYRDRWEYYSNYY